MAGSLVLKCTKSIVVYTKGDIMASPFLSIITDTSPPFTI
jgi:hypothetical protein